MSFYVIYTQLFHWSENAIIFRQFWSLAVLEVVILTVQLVMKISSRWQHFLFSVYERAQCINYVVKYHLRVSNTLRPRQNGRHFADDTFIPIFLNENIRISIKISLKFVPEVPINNIPALVQIMACRLVGANRNQWWSVYWRIYASLGLNELTSHGGLLVTHICVSEVGDHWLWKWLAACSAPRHYPKQW